MDTSVPARASSAVTGQGLVEPNGVIVPSDIARCGKGLVRVWHRKSAFPKVLSQLGPVDHLVSWNKDKDVVVLIPADHDCLDDGRRLDTSEFGRLFESVHRSVSVHGVHSCQEARIFKCRCAD